MRDVPIAWEKERAKYYRELQKDRPRCKERRPQEISFVKPGEKAPVRITKNLPCNMLLDRTGKCWFCGHKTRIKKEESDAS